MKTFVTVTLLALATSCSTPAAAPSSGAPLARDSANAVPGSGPGRPFNNRITPVTGTSHAPSALPDSASGSAGADSTAHR